MRLIKGGTYWMGSASLYPEGSPRRRVFVDSFWMDEEPVTNNRFAAFVEATSDVTLAEVAPNPDDYPGMHPAPPAPAIQTSATCRRLEGETSIPEDSVS
jgi:formylglycine-generating enzyme required for sulfatase activity